MSSKKKPSHAPVWQLKITLKHSSPPIWRRILVAGDSSLAELHLILQIVMGWTDSHLHQFMIDRRYYGEPDREFGNRIVDERKVKLMQVVHGEKKRFLYEYDFGDGWTHEIIAEKIIPKEEGKRYPVCVAGKRACPAEDCGGVWGYMNLLEALNNPKHPEHADMVEWIGGGFDSEAFDLDKVNQQLRRLR